MKMLKDLKLRRKYRFLVLRIEGGEVVPDATAPPAAGAPQLEAALPFSDCRYCVYDQDYTTDDGRKTSRLLFISWLPHNATPYAKMAYAHGKTAVRRRMEGLFDVAASAFADVAAALGIEDDEDSDSDLDS
ncbi:hypothetical protein JKP88DRAFT_230865 [Tribonema minus]|uniref:ADF-H domain-containing protein n=1 Tax=Tribonema minus TaxID=303371 RepID=A0A835ZF29_9STRA|nr:hypothetical protein JKP88DRAFT_230865 [Tribonema minus]